MIQSQNKLLSQYHQVLLATLMNNKLEKIFKSHERIEMVFWRIYEKTCRKDKKYFW